MGRSLHSGGERFLLALGAVRPRCSRHFGKITSDAMPVVTLDPRRGIALAFKPAEERDQLLRIWETAGRSGPTEIRLPGYREAISTDLLKRDLSPLAIRDGHITLYLRTNGFAAVRLIQ